MLDDAAALLTTSGGADVVVGAGLALVTVGIVFAALLALGFVIIVRRSRNARRTPRGGDFGQRANIALVRLDDDVASSADELGYAIAQFGRERASGLADAVQSARVNLTAAFALKQQLDDANPDTATQQREWNARILMLCETTSERLATERTVFDGLRGLERRAPEDLAAARVLLETTRKRVAPASVAIEAASSKYAASAVAPFGDNAVEATRLLESAATSIDTAAGELDDAGVGAVSASVRAAERDVRRAGQLLDDVDRHTRGLAESSVRLNTTLDSARRRAQDARLVRDNPPDPATGAAIADAIGWVERTIAAARAEGQRTDPDEAIARLEATTDALDTALAGARNQEQRLSHAREALAGALLTARSQIETTRSYMSGRRGGAGTEARTRLSESERLLAIAEAESDPVLALDTARSSATYSRDADALARYDLLH